MDSSFLVSVEDAFGQYDLDGGGTISSSELKLLCADLDVHLSDEELQVCAYILFDKGVCMCM
jgi:Ca2+-binding EF-hand superfamily protein